MNINHFTQKSIKLNVQYAFYYHISGQKPILASNCERFSTASIIKVPLLLAWVHLERLGEVNRSEICRLNDEPQVRGAGFSWLMRARKLPFQDVLLMMIALSDNLCTNLVIERIGIERANAVFKELLGLKGTELQRKMMDFEARKQGKDNWTTVQDCIRYYKLIHELTPEESAWVEPMLRVGGNRVLMRDIPFDTVTFHHKVGSIPGVLHDWGYTKDRKVFLLTQQVEDETEMLKVFGEFGREAVADLL